MSKIINVIKLDHPLGGGKKTYLRAFSKSGMGFEFTGSFQRAKKFPSPKKLYDAVKSLARENPEILSIEMHNDKDYTIIAPPPKPKPQRFSRKEV